MTRGSSQELGGVLPLVNANLRIDAGAERGVQFRNALSTHSSGIVPVAADDGEQVGLGAELLEERVVPLAAPRHRHDLVWVSAEDRHRPAQLDRDLDFETADTSGARQGPTASATSTAQASTWKMRRRVDRIGNLHPPKAVAPCQEHRAGEVVHCSGASQ